MQSQAWSWPGFALLALVLAVCPGRVMGQNAETSDERFNVREAMIPMRDGVRLHTRIFVPKDAGGPLPFILLRTPYGTKSAANNFVSYLKALADDGYIFAFQDLRGKFESEGVFVMQRPARA